jgi:hypothetical protein
MFGDPTAMPIPWPQYILLGPLYMLSRLRRIPNDLFAWCWMMVVIFLAIPIYTTWVDDDMGVAWFWGVELSNTWSQYAILGVCILIYEGGFLFEIFHILGIMYENDDGQPLFCGQIFEISFLSICIVVMIIGWGMLAYHAGQWWTVFTSTVSILVVATLVRVIVAACGLTRRSSHKNEI